MYSFDIYGFFSDLPIENRITNIAAPEQADWPLGKRPNFTGYEWIYLDYPPINIDDKSDIPDLDVRQLELYLNTIQNPDGTTMLNMVENKVASSNKEVQIWYARSSVIKRNNPMVVDFIAQLGMTPEQGDNIWIEANKIILPE